MFKQFGCSEYMSSTQLAINPPEFFLLFDVKISTCIWEDQLLRSDIQSDIFYTIFSIELWIWHGNCMSTKSTTHNLIFYQSLIFWITLARAQTRSLIYFCLGIIGRHGASVSASTHLNNFSQSQFDDKTWEIEKKNHLIAV